MTMVLVTLFITRFTNFTILSRQEGVLNSNGKLRDTILARGNIVCSRSYPYRSHKDSSR